MDSANKTSANVENRHTRLSDSSSPERRREEKRRADKQFESFSDARSVTVNDSPIEELTQKVADTSISSPSAQTNQLEDSPSSERSVTVNDSPIERKRGVKRSRSDDFYYHTNENTDFILYIQPQPKNSRIADEDFMNRLLVMSISDVKCLLASMHLPKEFEENSITIVTTACMAGRLDIAAVLAEKYPAAANIHSEKYGTPMQTMAFCAPHNVSLEDYTALIKALMKGREEKIGLEDYKEEKIEGADINETRPFSRMPSNLQGVTPIQIAIYYKNKPCTQALIECGADLTVKYPDGMDLLETMRAMLAIQKGCNYSDIIAILPILTPHFTAFGFKTKEDCEGIIKYELSVHDNSAEILKAFDLRTQEEIEAKAKAKAYAEYQAQAEIEIEQAYAHAAAYAKLAADDQDDNLCLAWAQDQDQDQAQAKTNAMET